VRGRESGRGSERVGACQREGKREGGRKEGMKGGGERKMEGGREGEKNVPARKGRRRVR